MHPRSVAADDHTKTSAYGLSPDSPSILSTEMNGPLARCNFFTSHMLPLQESLAQTNPTSPQVRGPPGMPRNSKPFSAKGSALPRVPKDEDHIWRSAVVRTAEWEKKIHCIHRRNILRELHRRNTSKKNCFIYQVEQLSLRVILKFSDRIIILITLPCRLKHLDD